MATSSLSASENRKAFSPTMTAGRPAPPYFSKIQNNSVLGEKRAVNIWNDALQEHYKRNPHHPEYFSTPSEMNHFNKKHMLCDLLGSLLGSQWKWNAKSAWDIPSAANVCKTWPKWKYVEQYYTLNYNEEELPADPRWPKGQFDDEKHSFVKWLKCSMSGKITSDEFVAGLYAFECVEHYMIDLQWHQYAVSFVGSKLFPDDDALKTMLEHHDSDKWDGDMIAAYVLKWLFHVEVIEMERNFKNICLDEFIYDTVQKGKEKYKNLKKKLQTKV
ncbi:hypothetical protein AVEN_112030-1 [Araneus ventricosus]|uniref:Uncharacterized protein n=1 Tax=Araneus ventricosus TaxID=182803 RepID=A0A4Y2QQD7_ARAVE|nr:hypothetical protein AVEN_112030-1 [Araneus ventricosus]